LRHTFAVDGAFRVATENTFPPAAGIASSASGFAAVTFGVTQALGLELATEQLSDLARRSGSGSAARSVLGGYVEWPAGRRGDRCHAWQLLPPEHWDLRDVVAVVDAGPKAVSSLEGHRRAPTSPYYHVRQRRLPARLETVRQALAGHDFQALAEVVEAEAIDLHCVAMTSRPPIFYWQPGTLEVLAAVRDLRADGVPACSTIDAGANVHVLCPARVQEDVATRLSRLRSVRSLIRDGVGHGPTVEDEHLI
jgi:diphosphomevalonate decarboxylase